MSAEMEVPAAGTAYGRLFRERGTTKIVLGALALALLWYGWDTIRTNQMLATKWPELKPDLKGLTVVGLRDKPKPGWNPRYVAVESNKSWQIRVRDDAEDDQEEAADPDRSTEAANAAKEAPEAADRGTAPGVGRGTARGRIVPVEEVLAKCPTFLLGSSFSGASMRESIEPLFARSYWSVDLQLTDEGRSRYWQFSRDHEDERSVFIVGGREIITCPRMKNMNVSTLTIEPIWVEADAKRLVDLANGRK
jgi:hypothetical protein